MASYYYFAASLPSIWMERDALISYGEFLERAKDALSKRDYRDLERAKFEPSEDESVHNHVVRDWVSFNNKLQGLLVEERAKALGIEDPRYEYRGSHDEVMRERVRSIVNMDDPLEAERALLSLSFNFLDGYRQDTPFTTEALMIYALKLQIKEREKLFERERGKKEFSRLLGRIRDGIFKRGE